MSLILKKNNIVILFYNSCFGIYCNMKKKQIKNKTKKKKRCTRCGKPKILDGFHKCKNSKDGYIPCFKQCCKKYREENKFNIKQLTYSFFSFTK